LLWSFFIKLDGWLIVYRKKHVLRATRQLDGGSKARRTHNILQKRHLRISLLLVALLGWGLEQELAAIAAITAECLRQQLLRDWSLAALAAVGGPVRPAATPLAGRW
jgi:hypothetical protein